MFTWYDLPRDFCCRLAPFHWDYSTSRLLFLRCLSQIRATVHNVTHSVDFPFKYWEMQAILMQHLMRERTLMRRGLFKCLCRFIVLTSMKDISTSPNIGKGAPGSLLHRLGAQCRVPTSIQDICTASVDTEVTL